MGIVLEFKKPPDEEKPDEADEHIESSNDRMRRIQDSLRRINDLMQELKRQNNINKGE